MPLDQLLQASVLIFPGFSDSPNRQIVDKIDGDKDGFVTEEELEKWIKLSQKRWIYEDVDRQFKGHDLDADDLVTWEEYKNATYGFLLGRLILKTLQGPESDPAIYTFFVSLFIE